MRLRDRLRKDALESCQWRGHEMTRFEWNDNSTSSSGSATCKKCWCTVSVDPNPAQNSIEIWGSAVAINCPQADCIEATELGVLP